MTSMALCRLRKRKVHALESCARTFQSHQSVFLFSIMWFTIFLLKTKKASEETRAHVETLHFVNINWGSKPQMNIELVSVCFEYRIQKSMSWEKWKQNRWRVTLNWHWSLWISLRCAYGIETENKCVESKIDFRLGSLTAACELVRHAGN